MTTILIIEFTSFWFAIWLGTYLIGRDVRSRRMRYAGFGLVAYALAVGVQSFAHFGDDLPGSFFNQVSWGLLLLPPVFWAGAVLHLQGDSFSDSSKLVRTWQRLILPAVILCAGLTVFSDALLQPGGTGFKPLGWALFGVVNLLPVVSSVCLFMSPGENPKPALGVLLAAALFFFLGSGLVVLPTGLLPRSWTALGLILDLELLGFVIAWLDAFDQGETLKLDMLRSLAGSFVVTLILAGQVMVAMALSTGVTASMLALLFGVITISVSSQTLSEPIQAGLDRLIFSHLPDVYKARRDLRNSTIVLARATGRKDPSALDQASFHRFTRSALRNYANLPRLSTNPLTYLPEVNRRLQSNGLTGSTLERAAELKKLLTESILRLKPAEANGYGTTDEWRYFNVLYYPYVMGLKPFSRRISLKDLDGSTREIMEWFRAYVPERTLYNWQKAAAKLVAQDLLERLKVDQVDGGALKE